jgi:signal transduction histidine kinase
MNRDLLELYSDYLLSAFNYTTVTGLSAMRERLEALGAKIEVRNRAGKGMKVTVREATSFRRRGGGTK